jgi:ketosteroid isomerase-like protein
MGALSWFPAECFASKSGDMGASWGRYMRTGADPAKKPLTGRYVTVRRKNADGKWRAIMDIGQPG